MITTCNPKMMYRTASLLITLLFLTSQAVADQIVLKNGDRLTGAIGLVTTKNNEFEIKPNNCTNSGS